MEPRSHVEAFEHAARKNIAAIELAEKGKLREALNALNQAVAAAPSYHLTYANRAVIFQRMGLLPQAEADRRKAAELAADLGEEEPEAVREEIDDVFFADSDVAEDTAERPAVTEPQQAPPPVAIPLPAAEPLASNPLTRRFSAPSLPKVSFAGDLLIPVAFFVLLIAFTAGTLIIALAVLQDNGSDLIPGLPGGDEPPAGSPQTETAAPTAAPPPIAASPFSSSSLVIAWRGRGITASLGSPSEAFSGFNTSPVDMSLTGDGSAQMSVFFYSSREGPQQDWDLVPGSRPVPKAGRVIPPHVSIWWNANVIIVVRSASGALSSAALDAFLNLGG